MNIGQITIKDYTVHEVTPHAPVDTNHTNLDTKMHITRSIHDLPVCSVLPITLH